VEGVVRGFLPGLVVASLLGAIGLWLKYRRTL